MKRIILLACALVILAIPAGSASAQKSTNDFKFKSFEADYYLSRDDQNVGTLRIKEELVAVFPDFDQNHGIERALPTEYQGNSLNIDILSVTDGAGNSRSYTEYTSEDFHVVRIGDADTYVHGEQQYDITYTMRNVITFYDDHDELYWDTNGTAWQQPFDSLIARFHFSGDVAAALNQDKECFKGAFGESGDNCTIDTATEDTQTVTTVTATNLEPQENVSAVFSFDSGTFAEDPTQKRLRIINIAAIIIFPLAALWHSYDRWRRNGRDIDRTHVIVPQYVPPAGINSVSAGVILDETMKTQAISAGILELATLGYVSISEKVTDKRFAKDTREYSVTLEKDYASVPKELQEVADLIFAGDDVGTTVKLDTLKDAYVSVQGLKKSIPKRLARRGYFISDPVHKRSAWSIRGIVVTFVGVGILVMIGETVPLVGLGVLVAGIIMLAWTKAMPARTSRGSRAYEHLEGLKKYIEMAEQERLEFHQSPEGARYGGEQLDSDSFKLRLYENLLPYALLFGLAEKWSQEFKDLYQEPPQWYNTNSASGFNAMYLASSLNNFSAASATTFNPQGSSSSGSSGFSGGFSGGGGGGGGGGGW